MYKLYFIIQKDSRSELFRKNGPRRTGQIENDPKKDQKKCKKTPII